MEPLSGCEAHSVLFIPCPRQQLVEIVRGPAVDELGEDVGEIGFGVDAVNLGGLDQGRETGPTCRTASRPAKRLFFRLMPSPVHSAHVGRELEVHYPWHPYFGRRVVIRRVAQRATGRFLSILGPAGVVVTIADWMLDPIVCAACRRERRARISRHFSN